MSYRSEHDERTAARGVAFDAWFRGMCRYFGRKVDPTLQAVYEKALAHVPVADLEAILTTIVSRSDAPKREIPRVDLLLRKWTDYRERIAPRPRVDTTDEFERQRRILTPLVQRALNDGPGGVRDDAGPEWAVTIARYVGQQFHNTHPGGTTGVHATALETYFQLAYRIYRDEVAAEYQLAPCET